MQITQIKETPEQVTDRLLRAYDPDYDRECDEEVEARELAEQREHERIETAFVRRL